MTVRGDITIDFGESPRIIRVAAPSTELTVQDLVDTMRALEDDALNIDDEFMISAAGKEALGGGVLVGITATLNDAQVQFEERLTSVESGTVTSLISGDEAIRLIDSAGQFITNGVERGAAIVNMDDGCAATVIRIVSENEIYHSPLQDGTLNQWTVTDRYKIWNTIQCDLTGGNVVAEDLFGAELSPVMPSSNTQVVRTASSSATLREEAQIEYSSFNGGVHIDVGSGNSGTAFPIGTLQAPVNNVADALIIAAARGFNTLFLLSDVTLATETVTLFRVTGIGPGLMCTVAAPATVTGAVFKNLEMTGTFDTFCEFVDCHLTNVSALDGALITNCLLSGVTTVTGTNDTTFVSCVDGEAGATDAIIDMTGLTAAVSFRGWFGGIDFRNKTDSNPVVVDMQGGDATLESTVAAGDFTFAGVGVLQDDSTGTATVDRTALISNPSIATTILTSTFSATPTANSVEEALTVLMGLMGKSRVYQDNFVYNANGFLTSCRIRVFATSAAAQSATPGGTGEGEVFTTTLTGTPDAVQLQLPATVLGAT